MRINHDSILRIIPLGVLFLLIQATTQAQTIEWKPLLGASHPDAGTKYTPKYGIAYQANGFDEPKRKFILVKMPRYLQKKGAGHIVEPFQDFAIKMTEDESAIPNWIDESWEKTTHRWMDCGGRYAVAAIKYNPRSLLVVVEDRPFWMNEHKLYANGTTDGRTIRVVNITTGLLFSDPAQAYLVKLPDLLNWEMGNTLQVFVMGYPKSIEAEIGSKSPCGK